MCSPGRPIHRLFNSGRVNNIFWCTTLPTAIPPCEPALTLWHRFSTCLFRFMSTRSHPAFLHCWTFAMIAKNRTESPSYSGPLTNDAFKHQIVDRLEGVECDEKQSFQTLSLASFHSRLPASRHILREDPSRPRLVHGRYYLSYTATAAEPRKPTGALSICATPSNLSNVPSQYGEERKRPRWLHIT